MARCERPPPPPPPPLLLLLVNDDLLASEFSDASASPMFMDGTLLGLRAISDIYLPIILNVFRILLGVEKERINLKKLLASYMDDTYTYMRY